MNIVPWNPKKKIKPFLRHLCCLLQYSNYSHLNSFPDEIQFRNMPNCLWSSDGSGVHNGQLKLTNLWVVWGSSHYKPLTALNVKIKAKISNYEKSSKLWKLWLFFVFPIIFFASLVDSFWDGVFKFELYNDLDLFHTKQ